MKHQNCEYPYGWADKSDEHAADLLLFMIHHTLQDYLPEKKVAILLTLEDKAYRTIRRLVKR